MIPPNSSAVQPAQGGAKFSVLATALWWLAPALILIASFAMSVQPGRRVTIPSLDVTLPELCTFYVQFGWDCPGCGMTRAFVHVSHGQFAEAMRLNPIAVAGYLFTVVQVVLASIAFATTEWRSRWISDAGWQTLVWINQWTFVLLLIAMTVQFLIKTLWRVCS